MTSYETLGKGAPLSKKTEVSFKAWLRWRGYLKIPLPILFGVLVTLSSCQSSVSKGDSSENDGLFNVLAGGRHISSLQLTVDPTPQVTYSDPDASVVSASASGVGTMTLQQKTVDDLSLTGHVVDVANVNGEVNQSSWTFRMNKIASANEYLTVQGGVKNYRISGQVSVHGDRTLNNIPQTEGVWGDLTIDTRDGTGALTLELPIHPYRQFKTAYVFSFTIN